MLPQFDSFLNELEKQGRKHTIYDRDNITAYLNRWYVSFPDSVHRERKEIPFNTFIHQFLRSDDDVFHTHPWAWFHSTIISGGYWEHTPWSTKWYGPGEQRYVDCLEMRHIDDDPGNALIPANLHWLEIPEPGKTWTLFTRGPTVNNSFWGFWPNADSAEIIFHETYLSDDYKRTKNSVKTVVG